MKCPNQQGSGVAIVDEVTTEVRKAMLPVILISWGADVIALCPILYMFEVYDRVVSTRDVGTLLMLSAALIFAVAMAEVLHFFRSRLQAEAARHIESKLAGPVAHAVVGAQLATQPLRARDSPGRARHQPVRCIAGGRRHAGGAHGTSVSLRLVANGPMACARGSTWARRNGDTGLAQ